MINDLMVLKTNNIEINDSPYLWNNYPVPRVTHILSSMIHEDFLMYWSNSLGWKRKGYKQTLQISADIGSLTHDHIEKFLKTNDDTWVPNPNIYDIDNRKAKTAFLSFLSYIDMLKNNGHEVEILYSELPLICPYYGGTCDAIIRIDGKVYVYDWKTSNQMSYKYIVQVSSYIYILEKYYWIHIDGLCIVRFSKDDIAYEEVFLDFENPEQKEYVDKAFEFFCNLLQGYYNRMYMEENFKKIKGD